MWCFYNWQERVLLYWANNWFHIPSIALEEAWCCKRLKNAIFHQFLEEGWASRKWIFWNSVWRLYRVSVLFVAYYMGHIVIYKSLFLSFEYHWNAFCVGILCFFPLCDNDVGSKMFKLTRLILLKWCNFASFCCSNTGTL